MEKRSIRRYNIPLRALLSYSNAPAQMLKTRDISAGGAFFETDRPRPEGTEVFMSLFMSTGPTKPTRERNVVRIKGKVRRRSEIGMAVCFDQPYQFAWM